VVRNPHGTKKISAAGAGEKLSGRREAQGDLDLDGDGPADAGKVPDFGVLDNVPELHTTKRDSIVIRANYQLVIDIFSTSATPLSPRRAFSAMPTPWNRRSRSSRTAMTVGGGTARHQFDAARHVAQFLARTIRRE